MYIMFRKLLPDVLLHNPDEETELLEEKVPEGVVIRADNGHHARDHLGIITNIWEKNFLLNQTILKMSRSGPKISVALVKI